MAKKRKRKLHQVPKNQTGPWLTVGELKRQLIALKVSDDASIKLRGTSTLERFKYLIFDPITKEVSLF